MLLGRELNEVNIPENGMLKTIVPVYQTWRIIIGVGDKWKKIADIGESGGMKFEAGKTREQRENMFHSNESIKNSINSDHDANSGPHQLRVSDLTT